MPTKQFTIPPGLEVLSGVLTKGHTRTDFIHRLSGRDLTAMDPGPLLIPPSGEGPKPPAHWSMTRFYLPVFILLTSPGAVAATVAYLTLTLATPQGSIALVTLFPIPLIGLANNTALGVTVLGSDLTNPTPVWSTQSIQFLYTVAFDQDVTGTIYIGVSMTVTDPNPVAANNVLDFSVAGTIDYTD